jgi:hypothetical protein
MDQSRSFGRPVVDLGVSNIAVPNISVHKLISGQHIDPNYKHIEYDIHVLVDQIDHQQKIIQKQAEVIKQHARYHQSPWFTKETFTYHDFTSDDWNDAQLPNDAHATFERRMRLPMKFKAMFVLLPYSEQIGGVRHAAMFPKMGEALVYITHQPEMARRLSSFDLEWLPPGPNSDHQEIMVGHHSLLKCNHELNGILFGSTAQSTSGGTCVVLSQGGSFYIQEMYIDTIDDICELVLVGQKYATTLGTRLPGFCVYGVDEVIDT